MKKRIPHYYQSNEYSCGAATLRMVLAGFGVRASETALARALGTNARTGTSRKTLATIAKARGLRTESGHGRTLRHLAADLAAGRMVVVLYREPEEDVGHFAVCLRVTGASVTLHDPWHGPHFTLPRREFLRRWHATHRKSPRWAMTFWKEKKKRPV